MDHPRVAPNFDRQRSRTGTAHAASIIVHHFARTSRAKDGRKTMLGWVVTFIFIALIAALFGFGGIAASAASFAKILFFLFLVLAVVAFFMGRRAPT
jgi:uncharacterized membrane protein YtjA (UPF0391 family)